MVMDRYGLISDIIEMGYVQLNMVFFGEHHGSWISHVTGRRHSALFLMFLLESSSEDFLDCVVDRFETWFCLEKW